MVLPNLMEFPKLTKTKHGGSRSLFEGPYETLSPDDVSDQIGLNPWTHLLYKLTVNCPIHYVGFKVQRDCLGDIYGEK